MKHTFLILFLCWPVLAADPFVRGTNWVGTMVATRAALGEVDLSEAGRTKAVREVWLQVKEAHPIEWDWALQDGADFAQWLAGNSASASVGQAIRKAAKELKDGAPTLLADLQRLARSDAAGHDPRWLDLYMQACELRRQERLESFLHRVPRLVFTQRRTLRPSFFAYTEGQSDAQDERHFLPGSELRVLEMVGLYGKVRTLVADPSGVIRDPAVSWDGKRVVFAWKKSLDEDDYHLYELNVASNTVRQITSGKGVADYEPAFLPNGDLIFASTRCVQTVDCWWTEVSNLYTCDAEGQHLRRLSFDQVHSIYPQVLDDGRVIYTRWDYNDRGQIFPQPLFQMYPDGTGQTEYYGNNSWFPTTIAHARGIPGTGKALAILCGHHTSQAGKLAIIDPAKGRQENSGVQLVAPRRATPAERIDGYGQQGELWQYPYPLSETECLVTYAPLGWEQPAKRRGDADFGIYWMDYDGHRELLAWDPDSPCSQPVPLVRRAPPAPWVSRTDESKSTGTYYIQDIYAGNSLAGIPRGTIRKLRVVALDFRAAGVGHNGSGGPAGGALISTPVSIGNGTWDVKVVLGETRVHADGSAMFSVPARTPVYFQAVDERGFVVQTMRSWSTLQPGEYFGCVGCHESKNATARVSGHGTTEALKAGVQPLTGFYGPPRGFSFVKEIQPILDRHCIRCHKDRAPIQTWARSRGAVPVLQQVRPDPASRATGTDPVAFSLLGETTEDPVAKRRWSDAYLTLTQARGRPTDYGVEGFWGNCQGRMVNWISSQSVPEPLPPYSGGAARSKLMTLLEQGHHDVALAREEWEKIACWIDLLVPYCGDYREANAWTEDEIRKYEGFATKRRQLAELEQRNQPTTAH